MSTAWPDLSTDRQAWEIAKLALGEDALISELAAAAQDIKQALKDATE